jgi:outer membrane protein OmpU
VPALSFDSYHQWNLGGNLNFAAFNFGVVYTESNGGLDSNGLDRTWDLGADYTTGPFKLGVSWLNNHEGLGQGTTLAAGGLSDGALKTNRYAGGVVYTYGPGMTFRGSVGYVKTDVPDQTKAARTGTTRFPARMLTLNGGANK